MALQTLASSLNIKIAGITSPVSSGAELGLEGFIKDGAQTGVFIWGAAIVNVLARTMGATTWTIIEHLTSDNRTALVSWDDYDVIAFQSLTGSTEKIRIIPRFDSLIATTSDPVEVPRITKFSDLPEVPVYTAADDGKVFKVGVGGVLELSNPPNFNTQTTTFPSIDGVQTGTIHNTALSDALLTTPAYANGLVLSSFEATGIQVGSGITLASENTSNFIANNVADIAVDSYIHAPASASNNITDDFTVSMWFNRQASVIYPRLFMAHDYGQFLVSGNLTIHIHQPTGKLTVYSTTVDWIPATCPVISLDQWYHVTLTRNTSTSTMEMYLNGLSVGQLTGASANSIFSFQTVAEPKPTLGWLHAANDGSYTGKIEQACLWNRALSSDQVATLYNSNAADVTQLSTATLATSEPVTDIIIKGNNFESTSKVYLFNETDTVFDTALSDVLLTTPTYTNGLVLSSFETTGTQYGGGVTIANENTLTFNASNVAHIDIDSRIEAAPNAANRLIDDFTVAMWFNREVSGPVYPRLYMAHNYNIFLYPGDLTINIHQPTQKMQMYAHNAQFNWVPANCPVLTQNKWWHVTATRSAGVMYMYIDGVLVGTNSTVSAASDFSTVAAPSPTLGWLHAANDGSYAGKIDQACQWNRSLSQPEIAALYNTAIVPKLLPFYEDYENNSINNIMGSFAGEAGLQLPASNFGMFTKGNTELLVGWTETDNEYAGKVPFVFKNSNELSLRVNPAVASAAGTYSILVVNPDGNKNLYRNCIIIA